MSYNYSTRRFFPGPKLRGLIPCGYCFEEWADCYDHILPVAHGGTNRKSNLYPACRRCNSLVGAHEFKSLDEKRDYIRAKLKERNEWHSADEMQRMRGGLPSEEETPKVLLIEVPPKLVAQAAPKNRIIKRKIREQKIYYQKTGRPHYIKQPKIINPKLIRDRRILAILFPYLL